MEAEDEFDPTAAVEGQDVFWMSVEDFLKWFDVVHTVFTPPKAWFTIKYNGGWKKDSDCTGAGIQYNYISRTRQIYVSPWEIMSLHLQANTTNIYKLRIMSRTIQLKYKTNLYFALGNDVTLSTS